MDLIELKTFLKENTIKVPEKTPKTFLEIARQPHYENVISNIYAFFFNVSEEHGLKDLFIQSLIDCIKETDLGKEKTFGSFLDFNIDLEYTTLENGRIDILISSDDYAIIIENKIYHTLLNNLVDYWNTVISGKVKPEKAIGILLSLVEYKETGHQQFICITHIQLLNKVFDNIGKYLLTSNEKYLPFLKDFYQNILNLSNQNMNSEELNFALENQEKINAIIQIDKQYKALVKSEIEKAFSQIEGLTNYPLRNNTERETRLRYFESNNIKNLLITVIFDKLFDTSLQLDIFIELWGNRMVQLQEVLPFQDKDGFPAEVLVLESFKSNKNNWGHLAHRTFHLSKNDVLNLSSYISKVIEESKFLNAMHVIENKLSVVSNP